MDQQGTQMHWNQQGERLWWTTSPGNIQSREGVPNNHQEQTQGALPNNAEGYQHDFGDCVEKYTIVVDLKAHKVQEAPHSNAEREAARRIFDISDVDGSELWSQGQGVPEHGTSTTLEKQQACLRMCEALGEITRSVVVDFKEKELFSTACQDDDSDQNNFAGGRTSNTDRSSHVDRAVQVDTADLEHRNCYKVGDLQDKSVQCTTVHLPGKNTTEETIKANRKTKRTPGTPNDTERCTCAGPVDQDHGLESQAHVCDVQKNEESGSEGAKPKDCERKTHSRSDCDQLSPLSERRRLTDDGTRHHRDADEAHARGRDPIGRGRSGPDPSDSPSGICACRRGQCGGCITDLHRIRSEGQHGDRAVAEVTLISPEEWRQSQSSSVPVRLRSIMRCSEWSSASVEGTGVTFPLGLVGEVYEHHGGSEQLLRRTNESDEKDALVDIFLDECPLVSADRV
ncbi:uncharacterized protein LOC119112303 isoform X2 [Pollicipes pollicipes]|uniref:uncharacterized protein LOC119112303 isoform X2 n=1 Tax=Pollicipes pollicipes TaxID=41117 RepID=UPI0018852C72|nr:uncharacterized protein LOC119112303 isoform X2 [Pollicipes pollicipes]